MRSVQSAAIAASIIGLASAKYCKDLFVPVTISARNGVFDKEALTPCTDIEATDFLLNLLQFGKNYTEESLQGYATVSGSYHLAATYCQPDSGTPDVVQLLTHGIGFDRSYWDSPYNNYNYSYVNEAVDEYGFATFSWDRLGIGASSHGEPVNEIQAFLEVAALKALTDDLRAGDISGVPSFSKVVHVGHSFGSEHTYLLTAQHPNISDGIALTGFSQNGSFVPDFAYGGNLVSANTNPALSSYANGYLADSDATGVQSDFFAPGQFDAGILDYATATGQPVTIGELLTIGGETGVPNTFAGPVLIITGERDVPYCGGNCLAAPPPTGYPNTVAAAQKTFTNHPAPFDTVIVPGAGHGLNFEYSHPFTYQTINEFFVNAGLAPGKSTSGSWPSPTAWGKSGQTWHA